MLQGSTSSSESESKTKMASDRPDNFALELVRASALGETKNSSDAMVVFVHWRLIAEGLLCHGNGESFSPVTDSSPSELLPDGWASSSGVYVLRYRHYKSKEKFVFKAVPADAQMTVLLMRVGDEKTSDATLDLAGEIGAIDGRFVFKNEEKVLALINEELMKPFFEKTDKKEKGSEKEPKSEPPRRRRDPDDEPPQFPDTTNPARPGMPDFPLGPRNGPDPFFDNVGEADLGGHGGGMLMGPPGRRGPRDHQPRFDPMMPGGRMGGGRNLGDAVRPPGFDNMFM